jgi:hypothetical protein
MTELREDEEIADAFWFELDVLENESTSGDYHLRIKGHHERMQAVVDLYFEVWFSCVDWK